MIKMMKMEPVKLDKNDKELLQLMQDEFPLEERPWAILGRKLGLTEVEVVARVKKLSAEGVIRKLRTILDAQKLGSCSSTLMAMKVPEGKMEHVVSVVNEYMSVTHNYRREHDYNLWFTVTTCGGKKTIISGSPLRHAVVKTWARRWKR
jgi:DNA-binding Lrp family transcriptional regulator